MLQSLHIENVAVIEKSDITFGRGLTVLTGETGAGKSIVIDAINGALGERITRDIVRHGADKAYIAAVFDELSPAVLAKLEELGLEPEEDGTLLVQRTITADGKASCRINGRPIAVSALRELGRMLVNIHGQHENQTLLQAESHVGYLDRLGSLQEVHAAYEQAYRSYCQVRRTMKAAAMDEDEKQRRTAELEEKLAAIEAAALHPGEEAQLTARRELARHAGKLAGVLQRVREAMEDDENGNDRGALSRLADGAAALQSAGAVSADLGALGARLQSCLYDVQAVADEAAELEAALNFDEEELSALEDRLALIQRLCRQYGGSEEAVLETAVRLRGELEAISSNELYMAELQRQSDETRAATIEAAGRLTQARRQAAKRFEEDVCRQLAALDMPQVRLEVSIEPTPLTAIGGDKVEFLIASNVGEPPKSIARTASGGELSRIMLALKSVLAEVDDIDTLVFDEVDAGISGRAAARVGSLMRQIAGCRQVLCVTHLAQIAACGHSHLQVSKSVADGRTYTRVEELDETARRQELARIMGGEVTDSTMEAAAELRQRAEM